MLVARKNHPDPTNLPPGNLHTTDLKSYHHLLPKVIHNQPDSPEYVNERDSSPGGSSTRYTKTCSPRSAGPSARHSSERDSVAIEDLLPKLLPQDIFCTNSSDSGFSSSTNLESFTADFLCETKKTSSNSNSTSNFDFDTKHVRGCCLDNSSRLNPITNENAASTSPSEDDSQQSGHGDVFPLKGLDIHDDTLARATLDSMRTQSLIPILKQELKTKIQYSRLMSGKDELAVEFPAPIQTQLSLEEEEKVDRRREQNRVASKKFRHKRKEQVSGLAEKIQRLESQYSRLEAEAERLRGEKTLLGSLLTKHLAVCPVIKVLMDNVDISEIQPYLE